MSSNQWDKYRLHTQKKSISNLKFCNKLFLDFASIEVVGVSAFRVSQDVPLLNETGLIILYNV